MINKEETKKKIEEDNDFIYCPSAENSLEKFLKKHPNGVNNEKIASVLLMTQEEVEEEYEIAVEKLRQEVMMGDEDLVDERQSND